MTEEQHIELGSSRRRKRAKSSGRVEYNTPERIVEVLVAGLGPITCDPCWNERSPVRAEVVYTEADDGLSRVWPEGFTYINPPFGAKLITPWIDLLLVMRLLPRREIAMLTPNESEAPWFERLYTESTQTYAFRGRLKFSDCKSGAFSGHCLHYFGPREAELTAALAGVAYPMKGARS